MSNCFYANFFSIDIIFLYKKIPLPPVYFIMQNCYCCSGKNFEECCKSILEGSRKAGTAEELMRSRYSAYATALIEYLMKTTHSATRKFYDAKAIESWAISSKWIQLEIVKTEKGMSDDFEGFVEFKATYQDKEGKIIVHHENSHFLKEKGEWFFLEGKVRKS